MHPDCIIFSMVKLFACELVDEQSFKSLELALINKMPPASAQRALKYRFKDDAQRYIIGDLLARYALKVTNGVWPEQSFIIGDKGKPHPDGLNGLYFNISHSGKWVVVIVGECPVGVDVEKIRKVPDGVINRFFSESEKSTIDSAIDYDEKQDLFFTIWTLKESFLKTTGHGLTKSLSTFTVEKAENDEWQLVPDDETYGFYLKVYSLGLDYKLSACAKSMSFCESIEFISLKDLI